MEHSYPTREQLWAKQRISCCDVDYESWFEKREQLRQLSLLQSGCMFVVDVYKGRYDFASDRFTNLLGYPLSSVRSIHCQGDFLEDQIHPDDRDRMIALQIRHSEFIYSLSPGERNDYSTHYEFRIRNATGEYIRMISRQRVIEKDRYGKAWMIGGVMDIAPDQSADTRVNCVVQNLKTGELLSPFSKMDHVGSYSALTRREREVLRLIRLGLRSKEIADKLNLSIYTIHNHRKSILSKLGAGSAIEAIRFAKERGI